jgi:hypothetical protein
VSLPLSEPLRFAKLLGGSLLEPLQIIGIHRQLPLRPRGGDVGVIVPVLVDDVHRLHARPLALELADHLTPPPVVWKSE